MSCVVKFIKLQTVGNAAKLSETWKEGMLNTKEGTGSKKLVKLTINIFQSSFLLFTMFDTMLGRQILLLGMKLRFCHAQVIFQVP